MKKKIVMQDDERYYPYVRHRHQMKQAIIAILKRIKSDLESQKVPRKRKYTPEPKPEYVRMFFKEEGISWVEPQEQIIWNTELIGIENA